uniref:Calponin-homology (CH) domain-containing protein n=1 Tax=Biomphalaria glabrata TaxID=6526 RepID=A0A2C9LAL6_BIOGL
MDSPDYNYNLDPTTIKFKKGKDEREDVQKKTFTKWINSQLSKAKRATITDLFTDLRDGERLLSLLEVLGGLSLVRLFFCYKIFKVGALGRVNVKLT